MKLKSFFATLCCVSLLVAFSSCKSSDKSDNIDLIPVKLSKTGNWSMMDKDGKIVYQDEFKNQPTAAYNGFFSVEENGGYTLYKMDSKKPEPVSGCDKLKSVGYMEDGLIPVTFPNQRISVIDGKGNKKFTLDPIKNSEVIACSPAYSEGLLAITLEDGNMGYVDKSGKLAFPATYKVVTDFNDGLALVGTESKGKDDEPSTVSISVINKKGEQIFKLPEGFNPVALSFVNGKLLVKNEDVYYLFDKKGEKTKLSSKIQYVVDMNEDYIIYRSEDGQCGVLDYEGETVIRPKYESLAFAEDDDEFIGRREGKDNEIVIIDKKGEVEETLDYKELTYIKHFGYLAREGSIYTLLDDDFKAKCKDDIYDIALSLSHFNQIETDYFDVNGVAKTVVGMINSDGVGKYQFGTPASQMFSDKDPKDYAYRGSSIGLDELDKKGFRYEISATGHFTAQMADYSYDYSYYSTNYYWNPASKFAGVQVTVNSESELGEKGFNAMKSALTSAGFKSVKSGVIGGTSYGALFSKGTTLVCVQTPANGRSCEILIASSAVSPSLESSLKDMIDSAGKITESSVPSKYASEPDFSAPASEVGVVDSAVAASAYEDFEPEPDSDIDY